MFGTAWTIALALTLQVPPGPIVAAAAPPPQAPAVTWTDDRPLIRIFPNLLKDFRALPSTNSAIILSTGGLAAFAVHGADTPLANWSLDAGDPSYTTIGDVLGDGWTQAGGAVATYAIGKLAHSPQVIHIGSDLVRAQVLNAAITTTLKAVVDRQRPNGGHWSFPSGHTSATFASAAVLHAHYGWKAGIPAFATAGFVAWTRVRDRMHWLSDVAFGSAIGIVSGRTVAAKHGPRRVTIVPTPTKGGGAVMFFVNTSQKWEGRRRK